MTKKKKLPLVAICGRPNVGKSTLFNRLTGRQRAIVHSQEGITRDRFEAEASYDGKRFQLVDTGGIVERPVDDITSKMQEQVRIALREAKVVVFVVDGQQEITRVDEDIRDELFKYGKPVILAVNKADNHQLALQATDYYSLGMGDPMPLSASHNTGVEALQDAIVAHLPETADLPDEPEEDVTVTKVAVVGKPNVGKSSFVNAILNEERSIVTSTPGTTRDAIDIDFRWGDKEYLFIDTAGMRRKANIDEDVERYSISRSLRAIRRAHLALVLVDAVEGFSEQDKRIFRYVVENGTAMVIVYTKWDLVEDKERRLRELSDYIDLKAPFLKYVPQITISNVTRQRLFKTFEIIDHVAAEANKRVGTGELNRFMEALKATPAPAMRHGRQAKVKYMTQVSVKPTTFVLFVNSVELFHFSYLRYIENRLREAYGFDGVPLTLELREGQGVKKSEY